MKTAILLAMGLFLGLVAPYLWGNLITGAGVKLPQFIWSKSPPRTLQFTATAFFRAAGLFFVVAAAISFIVFRSR